MFKLIFEGVIVHLVLLISVFDIYFKSPVTHGIPQIKNNVPHPARRLVLFVGDGLRADTLYNIRYYNGSVPFLIRITKQGVWGISNTQVPTESRPGHVAIIAGLYEDPSAVFKGWKENPVDFDSVFNQSSATFAWGSPDILPIFSKGATKENIFNEMYSTDLENFSGKNGTAEYLNVWVLEKFGRFLDKANSNETLKRILQQEHLVFFFHFLGIDIAGHTYKPHSKEYLKNVIVTDECIEKIHTLINSFYEDQRTAFVFTSDHGMTDWGSHGDGSWQETKTPVIAWGAGIGVSKHGVSPDNWKLPEYRSDIKQADLAPFMSVLIGVPIPVNSVGILPVKYLNWDIPTRAQALFLNAQQLTSHFTLKETLIKQKLFNVFFKPFKHLGVQFNYAEEISSFMKIGRYNDVFTLSLTLIELSLKGIDYYGNYFSRFLLLTISVLVLGWIMLLFVTLILYNGASFLMKQESLPWSVHIWYRIVDCISIALAIMTSIILYLQNLSPEFYIYCFLNLLLWWFAFRHLFSVFLVIKKNKANVKNVLLSSLLYFMGLYLLVLSFKFRESLSVVLCSMVFWPLYDMSPFKKCKQFMILWIFTSIVLAMFPFLPTVGVYKSIAFVFVAGFVNLFGSIANLLFQFKLGVRKVTLLVGFVQVVSLVLTLWNILCVHISFENQQGLLFSNQCVSWALFFISILLLNISPDDLVLSFISLSLSLSIPFLLLSSCHEAFFPFVLMIHLTCWIFLEYHITTYSGKPLLRPRSKTEYVSSLSFRRSFFFLTYLILSFFGIGNISSLNSFDPSWTRSFLTVFSPFTMTVLILLKTVIPIFMVTFCLRVIHALCRIATDQIFIILLIYSDIMAVYFLYSVTNKGSWLQIGTSISCYIIMVTLILFLVILYGLAIALTPNQKRSTFDSFSNNFYLPLLPKNHRE